MGEEEEEEEEEDEGGVAVEALLNGEVERLSDVDVED